jgi:hypothetical protein
VSAALLAMSMPEIALIFFMSVFIVLVIRLAISRSSRWEAQARIPLEDSPEGGTTDVR